LILESDSDNQDENYKESRDKKYELNDKRNQVFSIPIRRRKRKLQRGVGLKTKTQNKKRENYREGIGYDAE
jgi:hypothetical protein